MAQDAARPGGPDGPRCAGADAVGRAGWPGGPPEARRRGAVDQPNRPPASMGSKAASAAGCVTRLIRMRRVPPGVLQ